MRSFCTRTEIEVDVTVEPVVGGVSLFQAELIAIVSYDDEEPGDWSITDLLCGEWDFATRRYRKLVSIKDSPFYALLLDDIETRGRQKIENAIADETPASSRMSDERFDYCAAIGSI